MFSKLSGAGAIALLMGSLISVEGQNQNRPVRFTPEDDDNLHDFVAEDHKNKDIYRDYSCNQCIRAGFTYMYEWLGSDIESSEVFKDLNEFQSYKGACCDKRKNGSLKCYVKNPVTKSWTQLTENETVNRPLSSQFKDKNVAIAACPTKRSVCGKKRHFIYDKTSKASKISVNFDVVDKDQIYVPGSDKRENFDISKDECHWLIQTKCGVPLIKYSHELNEVSKTKIEKLLAYKTEDILSESYKDLEFDFEGEKTANDYLRLGFIEYNPQAVQQFSSSTVQYNGDYPGFKSQPYFVKAAWKRSPNDFADLRQFVRVGVRGSDQEIERYLDVEQQNSIKDRWFPAKLITDDLFAYQQSLNDWDKKRIVNNREILKYNTLVDAYKKYEDRFNSAQKEFIANDDLRATQQGNAKRGRMRNGMIAPLADAQITDDAYGKSYTAYVNAFEEAREFYFNNVDGVKKPSLLTPPPKYTGYKYDDFMPVYGFGLMTAGTISLNDIDYGEYKSFGVLGQHGMNIKEKYDTLNKIVSIDKKIQKGEVSNEAKKDLEYDMKMMRASTSKYKMNAGVSVASNCTSSFTLLSLTPNTFQTGTWNAKTFKSQLNILIQAEDTDSSRPLNPDFITYPGQQVKIKQNKLRLPGAQVEDGAAYMKAASVAVASLAALTLF